MTYGSCGREFTEINNSMSIVTGRIDDMDKRIEELESMGNFDELYEGMQEAVQLFGGCCQQGDPSPLSIQSRGCRTPSLQGKDQSLEAQLKVCIFAVANGGSV